MAVVEVFTPLEKRVIPVVDEAINEAMAVHVYGDKKTAQGINLAELSDQEFVEVVQAAGRKPINPIQLCREALDYTAEASVRDVMDGLRTQKQVTLSRYLEHGVDPSPAWEAIDDIVGHTEAYITGYSRVLGVLSAKAMLLDPRYNGYSRWIEKLWVPQEGGHHDLLTFVRYATDDGNAEEFYEDHIRHLQIGMHVAATELIPTSCYLRGQEDSTTISYRSDEQLRGPVLFKIPRAIGTQEATHTHLYANVEEGVLEAFPDATVIAMEKEYDEFEMPGKEGIRDFGRKAILASSAGLLDVVSVKNSQRTRISRLKIAERTFETDEAKHAQEVLSDPGGPYGDEAFETAIKEQQSRQARAIERAQRRGNLLPAIIGVTVVSDRRTGKLSFPLSA